MKQVSPTDLQRLERKIDLLNDKLDRLLALQKVIDAKDPPRVQPTNRKQKTRQRQQPSLSDQETFQQQVLQGMKDSAMRMGLGRMLQHQFGLAQPPSAARIREYQRTSDPKAFDGLKRVGTGNKK